MVPKDILKKVRRIEIRTRKLVNDIFGGEYESVFKGQGIEFADVREYVPGDDIRTIDWNVTARSQHPFVKKFTETRELTVMFLVDASSSCYFGTGDKFKSEIAAEITALLAFSAVKNNDKVGMSIFTDRVEKYIPVKKGRQHVLRVIREILYFQPENKKTSLSTAFEYLYNMLNRRAVVFIISDFFDSNYEKALKVLSKEHDVIAIRIIDPRELELPSIGLMHLQDAENGEELFIDSGSAKLRNQYETLCRKRNEKLEDLFKKIAVDRIDIDVTKSYVEPIMRFFRMRERRF